MLTSDTVRPIAALITTYDQVDDARANIEIIRSSWGSPAGFPDVVIVHVFNGSPDWYPGPKNEDLLITVPPDRSHFTGAAELIDYGLAAVRREFPAVRYVVCLSADCWIYDPRCLCQTVDGMQTAQHRLAAASWEISESIHGLRRHGHPGLLPGAGLSTDFFVLDLPWAAQFEMIPLRFATFLRDHEALLNYFQEIPLLERYFEGKFLAAVRCWRRSRRSCIFTSATAVSLRRGGAAGRNAASPSTTSQIYREAYAEVSLPGSLTGWRIWGCFCAALDVPNSTAELSWGRGTALLLSSGRLGLSSDGSGPLSARMVSAPRSGASFTPRFA